MYQQKTWLEESVFFKVFKSWGGPLRLSGWNEFGPFKTSTSIGLPNESNYIEILNDIVLPYLNDINKNEKKRFVP